MQVDNYRVGLFKKELRNILGAPWVRFYWSKDRQHLCLTRWHMGDENIEITEMLLKRDRIDIKVFRDSYGLHRAFGNPKKIPEIDSISIPIDQDALPERKMQRGPITARARSE